MTKCEHCTPPQGLPILPIRYAIAPKEKDAKDLLPKWAESAQTAIISQKLSDQSQLALRVMGKGYLYMLLKMSGNNELVWQVYSVDDNGGFWRQHNVEKYGIASVSESDALIGCNAGEHQASDVAFITIEQPEQCEMAWLAYSRFKWTDEICQQYSDINNAQIRNERMQKIEPAKWLQSQLENNGVAGATDDNIKQVLGYQLPDDEKNYRYTKFTFFDTQSVTQSTNHGPLSSSDKDEVFLVDMAKFRCRSTCHQWNQEFDKVDSKNNSISLASIIQSAKLNDSIEPMMVGLWDSISIVEELQFWINHAYANILQVQTEREREIGLVQWNYAIKNAIESGQAQEFITQLDSKYDQYARLESGDIIGYLTNDGSNVAFASSPMIAYSMIYNTHFKSDEQKNNKAFFDSITANVREAIKDKIIGETDINQPNYNDMAFFTSQDTSIKNFQYEAAYLYQWVTRNTLNSKQLLEPKHETLFQPIFELETIAEANVGVLKQQFAIFKQQMIKQVEVDQLTIEAQKAQRIKQAWQKYESQIDLDRVKQFNQNYAKYDEVANAYVVLLINDLITCVDAREQKQHPFHWGNSEYLQCSASYSEFINELILTLFNEIKAFETVKDLGTKISTAGKQQGIKDIFSSKDIRLVTTKIASQKAYLYQLIDTPTFDDTNLFWDSIIAGKNLSGHQVKDIVITIAEAIQTESGAEVDEREREQLIHYFDSLFKCPNQVGDAEEIKNIINIPDKVKQELDGRKTDTVIDAAFELPNQVNSVIESLAEVDSRAQLNLNQLFDKKFNALSGHFLALVHYLKIQKLNFNSRTVNMLVIAVSSGMGVPADYLRYSIKYFAEFEQKIVAFAMIKGKQVVDILTTSYQRLANKISTMIQSEHFQPQIAKYLLGFQLFSLVKVGHKILSSDELDKNDVVSAMSGLMAAMMLSVKALQPVKKLAELNQQIQTSICPQQKRVTKVLAKRIKLRYFLMMRFGNGFGAVGTMLGIIPMLSEEKNSVAETLLKWTNISSSLTAAIDMMMQAFGKEGLKQFIKSIVVKSLLRASFIAAIGRIVGFLLNPIIGAIVFVLTTIVSLFVNNKLQNWFASNRFGTQFYLSDRPVFNVNRVWSAYDDYQEELDAIGEILNTKEYQAKQAQEKEQRKKTAEAVSNNIFPSRYAFPL